MMGDDANRQHGNDCLCREPAQAEAAAEVGQHGRTCPAEEDVDLTTLKKPLNRGNRRDLLGENGAVGWGKDCPEGVEYGYLMRLQMGCAAEEETIEERARRWHA